MNRARIPCDMCDKSFVNLASHKRKVHDYFTFLQEEDKDEQNIWIMYKNDNVFERYIPFRSGTEENTLVYKSTVGVRKTYLIEYNDPECTFEVLTNHDSVVIKRRPIMLYNRLPAN